MVHESIAAGTGFGIGTLLGPTRYFASFSRWSCNATFFSGAQNEMWTRLGPQEAYGVPLVLAGLAWIAVQLGRHNWQPARLFPGFAVLLLAGFVKESFVPVLPGVLAFIYIVMPLMLPSIVPGRPRFRLLDVLILLLLVTGVGTQGWLTVKMLKTYGHQRIRQRFH